MRIGRDAVFVSSVLFTIALLCLVPTCLRAALSGHDRMALEALDAGYRAAAQTMGDLGVASMAIIFIGLIVTWTGYVKRARWAWLVLFIVVWVWAFPVLVLPLFQHTIGITLAQWLSDALHQPGPPRSWGEGLVIFSLMVVALILPVKSFFRARKPPEKAVD